MASQSSRLQEYSECRRIAGIGQIGRRHLAMNAFDGILTMIGVLMGSYIAGISDPFIVLYTGLATSVAMGISGFWGAYMTESAERKHELAELEQAMLRNLSQTKKARAGRFAVVAVSIIDGLSPLVAGFIVVSPFLLPVDLLSMHFSYYVSLGIAMAMLFALGVFLAKVARENIVRSGVRMLFAGLACVGLSFLLGASRAH
jgi:predicted membrane protein (TIGR00267 family)